jgi:hypothetical protein
VSSVGVCKVLIGTEGREQVARNICWSDCWRDRILGCGLDSSGSGLVPLARCCGYGNEPSGFAKLQGID